MKKLLIYQKNYIKETILAPLFKLLEACFELIVPLLIADIIDTGIKNQDIPYILRRCAVIAAFTVVGMIMAITAQYYSAKAAAGFGLELRQALFKKIQGFSFSDLDNFGASSLITRTTSDVAQLQNGVNLVLRLLLRSPFIVIGAMIMAFTIDVHSALVFALAIVLLSITVFFIMSYTVPRYRKAQYLLDNITSITRENLTGARVIRAFTAEEREKKEFSVFNNALSKMQKLVSRISSLMNPLTYAIVNLSIVFLIYIGSIKVDSGDLTSGQVVALYNYMSQILIELLKLAVLIVALTKSFACSSRIVQVLEQEQTLTYNNDDKIICDSVVSFDGVTLSYQGSAEESLRNISFDAKKGEIIGIIGGTGSGKSSLISMILHFYNAASGKVIVFGRDVKSYTNDNDFRSKISYAEQNAVLFKGTVRDNMRWGKKDASDDEMIQALRQAQIYDDIQAKGGLDAIIEQNGANFSGGQKQRLSIARAFVRSPEILILDDSFSALDYATAAKIQKEIYLIPNNPTIFIVSQRASSVMAADQIIVLDDGEIVGKGTHDELLNDCDIYKDIYTSQFGEEGSNE